VLFSSVSANYGLKESGLNQLRGNRVLESFDPGLSGGFSFGFAYSFNYDVSLTMSYQQSFNTGAKFYFKNDESYQSADQSSAMLSFALGVRVSPETIVNGTVAIGLTEDAPDVSLGLIIPTRYYRFRQKSSLRRCNGEIPKIMSFNGSNFLASLSNIANAQLGQDLSVDLRSFH
jgi:hypothetical protein